MNVLALHRMGDPRYRREAVRSLEYMISECSRDVNCVVHDADLPFPEYLRQIDYHLIVLGPTFLCSRYDQNALAKTLKHYDFVRLSNACKVALPQDDYDCSGVLDNWMMRWHVDRVYTVCPRHWDVLYPTYRSHGEVVLGYTGYVSDAWIDSWKDPKPHAIRQIDVCYRASKLSASFGSTGALKAQIANNFLGALADHSLRTDISVDSGDMIPGHRWHEFLENSRFCLATASGSSILDETGSIKRKVSEFCIAHPNATFEDIQQNCFPGKDREFLFTAISPRNIEAALAETVQIATPGSYSELMFPMKDYIPLEEDCSNIRDVLRVMNDSSLVEIIKRHCKESILAAPRLRRSVIVREIIDFAQSIVTARKLPSSSQAKVETLFGRYEAEIEGLSKKFWLQRRINGGFRSAAVKLGARHVKRWLSRAKTVF